MNKQETETESEARARRSVHVVGAAIVLLTIALVVAAGANGGVWLKARQLRAIQIGARADLDLVAEAQKKFYAAHGFYTTDLKALELWPKRVLYAFGFVSPAIFPEALKGATETSMGPTPWDPELRTIRRLAERRAEDAIRKSKIDPAYKPDAPILLSPVTGVEKIDFDLLKSVCADCTATKTGFKLLAAANLDGDSDLDLWTIDEKGTVTHVNDDLSTSRP